MRLVKGFMEILRFEKSPLVAMAINCTRITKDLQKVGTRVRLPHLEWLVELWKDWGLSLDSVP